MEEESRELLAKYIPAQAVSGVLELIFEHKNLKLIIKNSRRTKLGDYRKLNRFQHQITVNHDLNPYQFLITLLHEIAHFLTYKEYGRKVKPHGVEWKSVFGKLLQDYIKPDIFPEELIPDLLQYAQNPKASTAGDGVLYIRLAGYNKNKHPNKKFVFELEKGMVFALDNGQVFKLLEKKRTRYKCKNVDNKKIYLIHQNAEVFISSETDN